jgi:hypothetical protein
LPTVIHGTGQGLVDESGTKVAWLAGYISATVQPRLIEGVWLAQPYIKGHYDIHNPARIIDGHITLPKGPGINEDGGCSGNPVCLLVKQPPKPRRTGLTPPPSCATLLPGMNFAGRQCQSSPQNALEK